MHSGLHGLHNLNIWPRLKVFHLKMIEKLVLRKRFLKEKRNISQIKIKSCYPIFETNTSF